VAQLVEALRYKPEGGWFDSRWCHWHNPSVRTMALGSTQPLTEVSTRNISCGGKGVMVTTLPPSCADSLHLLVPQGLSRPAPALLWQHWMGFINASSMLWGIKVENRKFSVFGPLKHTGHS
jgi:hypothetical protein